MGQIQSIPRPQTLDGFLQDVNKDQVYDFLRWHKWQLAFGGILCCVSYSYLSSPRNLPPGPKGVPILGAAGALSPKYYEDWTRLGQKYGDIYSMYIGRQLNVILNSNRAIKEAFLKSQDFNDRPNNHFWQMTGFKDELFNSSYNEKWKENKKFAFRALKSFGFGTAKGEMKIQTEVNTMIKFLEQNQEPINLKTPFMNVAANVISSIIFNHTYSWDNAKLKEFTVAIDKFFNALTDEFRSYGFLCELLPTWLMKILTRNAEKRIKENVSYLRCHVMDHIKEHRSTFDENDMQDTLDVYIKERSGEQGFDDDVFCDTICTFLPDSVDTTATTLCWIFLFLGLNQDVQKRIQDEIDSVCGQNCPSLSDRSRLHFLEAAILESMRLGNTAPQTPPHCSSKNTTLGGYNIPKSANVIANLYGAHMDPSIFPNPKEFDPSRHLDEKGTLKKNHNVISFGVGTRMCMGEMLVRSEIFLCSAMLLQRFKFVFPEDKPLPTTEPVLALLLYPQDYEIRAITR